MEERRNKIRALFAAHDADAILTFSPENRRYVTSFTGSSGYVILAKEETVLLTDSRYIEQASKQATGVKVVLHQNNWLMTLKEQLDHLSVKRLLFEQDTVSYKLFHDLTEVLPDVTLVPSSGLIEIIRQVKDAGELAIMREAAHIADQAFTHILEFLRPGLKETDVALELEVAMRKLGATGSSFDTIVASGERSAMPHGVASDRVIQTGEFVKMDYGCFYDGYASDITRTVAIGQPSPRHKEIYELVLAAQLTAVNGMRAGLTGEQADALARDVIKAGGYGDHFGHSLGHGLGLAVHESPRVAQRSSDMLKEGMVVTIEPGIYIPGFGGVRIEDDVVLTGHTCERLTLSSKDLIIL